MGEGFGEDGEETIVAIMGAADIVMTVTVIVGGCGLFGRRSFLREHFGRHFNGVDSIVDRVMNRKV